MKYFLLVPLFLVSLNAYSQKSINTSSYKDDLAIYKTALEQTHPDLYRFSSKEQFDSLFNLIESNLNMETTEIDFFRSISRVTSLIREGHSYVKPSLSITSETKNKLLFPFEVVVMDTALVIKDSYLEEFKFLKGVTIYSINKQSTKSILQSLSESTCSVSTFNNSSMKSRLSLYNNFALAYYYFIDTTSNFRIQYQTIPTSKLEYVDIKGSSKGTTKGIFPQLPSEPKPPFYLKVDQQNSLAILRISTFAYWVVDKKMKDYFNFFKESFSSIHNQKIKNLIIDVRGNRGGEEMIAGELLTYLLDYEFKIYKYCKANTLDFEFTNSLPNSNKVRLSQNNYLETGSGFVLKKGDFLESFSPKKKEHFSGNIYILSNGLCSSACNTFLALVKTHKVGTIIGQESGGAFEDVDGRLQIRFTLPYSGITVNYPAWSMKLNTKGGDKKRGVIPDHEVALTIEEILLEKDVEMETTMKLIRKK